MNIGLHCMYRRFGSSLTDYTKPSYSASFEKIAHISCTGVYVWRFRRLWGYVTFSLWKYLSPSDLGTVYLLPVSVHAPCPRPVSTGVKNDTRAVLDAVLVTNTARGRHGCYFLTPVFTGAGPHYPYSRPVDTGRKYGYVHRALAGYWQSYCECETDRVGALYKARRLCRLHTARLHAAEVDLSTWF